MFATLIGPVDFNAALVLCVLFVTVCVIVTTVIVNRRSKQEVANEFELAKLKQKADDTARLYGLDTDRQYKFKQLETNMITSHRVEKAQ